jgi:hypothetical protein
MSLNGSQRVRLTDNNQNDSVPSWSPDGATIAYLTTTPTGNRVKLVAPHQTEAQAQTLSINFPQQLHTTFKWMPDGTTLLFHSLDGTRILPTAYNLATGTLTRLSAHEAYYPAPSPSGEQVAALMPTRGGQALALLTAAPIPRLLTGSLSPRIGVVWEDESHLLYLSEDRLTILRVNVQTGQISPAYHFNNHVMNFALIP